MSTWLRIRIIYNDWNKPQEIMCFVFNQLLMWRRVVVDLRTQIMPAKINGLAVTVTFFKVKSQSFPDRLGNPPPSQDTYVQFPISSLLIAVSARVSLPRHYPATSTAGIIWYDLSGHV